MPSVCFATVKLQRSWESSLLLTIMRCFLCYTLVIRNPLSSHLSFHVFLHLLFFMCSILIPCGIPLHYTYFNYWTYLLWCLCMYGLLWFLPTSGENLLSTAPFGIYFSEKNVDVFNTYFLRCMQWSLKSVTFELKSLLSLIYIILQTLMPGIGFQQ